MAFISENWLKQDAIRNRSHSPVSVQMEIKTDESNWNVERGILLSVYLNAIYEGGNSKNVYKGLYLTQSDFVSLAEAFAMKLDEKSVAELLVVLAKRLDDSKLLDQIGKARRQRDRENKSDQN